MHIYKYGLFITMVYYDQHLDELHQLEKRELQLTKTLMTINH